jgi:hypothetical protein
MITRSKSWRPGNRLQAASDDGGHLVFVPGSAPMQAQAPSIALACTLARFIFAKMGNSRQTAAQTLLRPIAAPKFS